MTIKLPKNQKIVFEAASPTEEKTFDQLSEETKLKLEHISGASFALDAQGLISITTLSDSKPSLTDEGSRYLQHSLPELRLYQAVRLMGEFETEFDLSQAIDQSSLNKNEVGVALSNYARKDYGTINQGKIISSRDFDPKSDPEQVALASIGQGTELDQHIVARLESRGLINTSQLTTRSVILTKKGILEHKKGVKISQSVTNLTPQMLSQGNWENLEYTAYNVEAEAAPYIGGRVHILRDTAERVKDTLVSMGFQEMEGPHADSEFWINDCLFMPQDHPARTHWDQFALSVPPAQNLPPDIVEKVQSSHLDGVGTDGDGYHSPWSEDVALGIDLRGHTTSLSMRYLSGQAIVRLEPPQRLFSVEKVKRNDTLDPTHLLEFFQIEGWVMAENLSVRDLMGTFTEFYRRFGITNLKFKPHYNPYTEPSFELFGEHPRTGELIEIGNSGLFRDEVLRPLGVNCDVMAWGLALDRLLMLMYGFEDIRDVHGTLCDLQLLRSTEVPY